MCQDFHPHFLTRIMLYCLNKRALNNGKGCVSPSLLSPSLLSPSLLSPSHRRALQQYITVSTENATSQKSNMSRNSNFSVQTRIQPKSQSEFVPRDTEESEFLDRLWDRKRCVLFLALSASLLRAPSRACPLSVSLSLALSSAGWLSLSPASWCWLVHSLALLRCDITDSYPACHICGMTCSYAQVYTLYNYLNQLNLFGDPAVRDTCLQLMKDIVPESADELQ